MENTMTIELVYKEIPHISKKTQEYINYVREIYPNAAIIFDSHEYYNKEIQLKPFCIGDIYNISFDKNKILVCDYINRNISWRNISDFKKNVSTAWKNAYKTIQDETLKKLES